MFLNFEKPGRAMNKKECPFCGRLSSSDENCYCFLQEDGDEHNVCLKPHVDGFESKANKNIYTQDNAGKFPMEDFEKFNLSIQKSISQPTGYLSDGNILPENSALGISFQTSTIEVESISMDKYIMQSESPISTPENAQSHSGSAITSESKDSFETSDFDREETEVGDANQARKVKSCEQSLTASGEPIPVSDYKGDEIVSNEEPLIHVADVEETSVARLSGIHSQTRRHRKVKRFGCDICKKYFRQKQYLREHERTHTGDKAFGCKSCGKRFTQRTSLARYLRAHTGDKAFACDICGKVVIQSSNLKLHLQVHSGETNFECPHCDKKFRQKVHLNSHVLIHTGQKPYSCDTCGKRFGRKHCLKLHQLTHTGQKPFSCDTCSKGFTQKHHLTRHQLIHSIKDS